MAQDMSNQAQGKRLVLPFDDAGVEFQLHSDGDIEIDSRRPGESHPIRFLTHSEGHTLMNWLREVLTP